MVLVEVPGGSQVKIGKTREEVETLKTMVHRLNAELDMYQKTFRKLTPSEVSNVECKFKSPKVTTASMSLYGI